MPVYTVKVTEKHVDTVKVIAENEKKAIEAALFVSSCEFDSVEDTEVIKVESKMQVVFVAETIKGEQITLNRDVHADNEQDAFNIIKSYVEDHKSLTGLFVVHSYKVI